MLLLCIGIMDIFLGIIMYLLGIGEDGGFACLLFGVPCAIIGYFQVFNKKNNDERIKNWIDSNYGYNNLNSNNIKIELRNESNQVIVLDNNDRLYYGNEAENKFIEIEKDEILKADCNYKTSTKTIKKPIALVGTYKTVTDLIGVELSIITHSGTYSVFFGRQGIYINAERAERLVLILNEIISNKKNSTLNTSNDSNVGYCIKCGTKVIDKFCGECGARNLKYNIVSDEA